MLIKRVSDTNNFHNLLKKLQHKVLLLFFVNCEMRFSVMNDILFCSPLS